MIFSGCTPAVTTVPRATPNSAAKVREDFMSGVRSGVNGTPSFFVNGIRHDSPYGVATLASAIDQAILAVAA